LRLRRRAASSSRSGEVNALGETLRQQRLGALEATALLRKVMEEIDVAVFAIDGNGQLRLVNRAGERILNQPEERLLGENAAELGLAECLTGDTPRIEQIAGKFIAVVFAKPVSHINCSSSPI
jgi:nitrogen fixation/metabolism regulation signal transduction histidine kinase